MVLCFGGIVFVKSKKAEQTFTINREAVCYMSESLGQTVDGCETFVLFLSLYQIKIVLQNRLPIFTNCLSKFITLTADHTSLKNDFSGVFDFIQHH